MKHKGIQYDSLYLSTMNDKNIVPDLLRNLKVQQENQVEQVGEKLILKELYEI